MKKYFLIITAISFLVISISCKKNQEEKINQKLPQFSPEFIGKLHNEILKELDYRLLETDELKTIDEFTSVEMKFSKEIFRNRFNKNLDINPNVEDFIQNSNRKIFLNIQSQSKSQTEANDDLAKELLKEFEVLISDENFLKAFNPKEVIIMKDILSCFKTYEVTKDLEKLKEELVVHKESIENSNFDPFTADGYLSLMTISVAENSIYYWTEDPNTMYDADSKVVWWLVSDAVGAAFGAGGTILKSAIDKEEIDWSDVAIDGLIGGVGASIPGGKGFKKLVKKLL